MATKVNPRILSGFKGLLEESSKEGIISVSQIAKSTGIGKINLKNNGYYNELQEFKLSADMGKSNITSFIKQEEFNMEICKSIIRSVK